MGQALSPFDFDNLKDDVMKEAHIVKEIALLSYAEFVDRVKELNKISQRLVDYNGKSLLFVIKGGSDASIFWKGTVRVGCIRIIKATNKMEDYKLLNLKNFLKAYKMFLYHLMPMIQSEADDKDLAETSAKFSEMRNNPISTSMILNQIAPQELATDMEECCICMERMPEVTLPCAHSYCLFCIEQWNVSNKTCPVCREDLENTDETWVLPNIPESSEVFAELQKNLSGLATKLPEGT